ncbi:MAG: protein arginine kinase [Phycisphaerae bacterium]
MDNVTELVSGRGDWLKSVNSEGGIVISSRIRLARNLGGFHFLSKCSQQDRDEIQALIVGAINSSALGGHFFYVHLDNMGPLERQLLVERHLISRQHAEAEGPRGVALVGDETVALMVNEEDHLRMQVLYGGLQLDKAWQRINQLDDQLEERLEFAFHEQFGYLTACPTNIGTGIRVSVMMHLPALKITGEIERVFRAAKDMHLAVRGLYGEGTEATGDFYQISNQSTLGKTEEEIVEEFRDLVVPRITEYEVQARELLTKQKSTMIEDKVWRAIGMLKYARTISTEETLLLLSHLRMGLNMGMLNDVDLDTINELFLNTQQAHLQIITGQRLDGEQRSKLRADYIRRRLSNHQNN